MTGTISVLWDLPKPRGLSIRSLPGVRGMSSSVGNRPRTGISGKASGGGRRDRASRAWLGGSGRCIEGVGRERGIAASDSRGTGPSRPGVWGKSSAGIFGRVSWSLSANEPVGVGGRKLPTSSRVASALGTGILTAKSMSGSSAEKRGQLIRIWLQHRMLNCYRNIKLKNSQDSDLAILWEMEATRLQLQAWLSSPQYVCDRSLPHLTLPACPTHLVPLLVVVLWGY